MDTNGNSIQIKAGLSHPRILFIGGTPRGFELLKCLVGSGVQITRAYVLEEDAHEKVRVSGDMEALCRTHDIPVKVCKRLLEEDIQAALSSQPQICFVCGWRTILASEFYNNIPYGCFAAHDSLLPRYRGCAPLNWAIINGETKTGVTLFKIDDGPVDSGPVFGQKEVAITEQDTIVDVYPRIVSVTMELYQELLEALTKDTLTLTVQDESKAEYTTRRTPKDGEIDWSQPARNIYNLIRALVPPYPCAWTHFNGEKIYISGASLPDEALTVGEHAPGRVVSIRRDGIGVLCGEGQLFIREVMTGDAERVPANQLISSVTAIIG